MPSRSQMRPTMKTAILMPDEKPVSLNPLKLGQALKGLLAIPDPDATKPKARPKRKKAPSTPEKG